MPEGHSIHRLSKVIFELFGHQRLQLSSPQGRFSSGAALLNNQILTSVQAHGKHLFLGFSPKEGSETKWIHIHLGIYGSFVFHGGELFRAPDSVGAPRRTKNNIAEVTVASDPHFFTDKSPVVTHETFADRWLEPDSSPLGFVPRKPGPNVRLRLCSKHGVADLSGPNTCEVLNEEEKKAVHDRLGPDPLNTDHDAQDFIRKVRASRRKIASLIMDQSILAGVGNIYRAEVLFLTELGPKTSGSKVSTARLNKIWQLLVELMPKGVETGRITIVDPSTVPALVDPNDVEACRFYVYHRTGRPCLRCGTAIREELFEHRRLFWCPNCQRY